jgi:hypothetical protein
MNDKPELVSPFRIAFREEGRLVNVYLAKQGTMDDAMFIGSIMRSILTAEEPGQFLRFKEIFQIGIAAAIKDVMGIDVVKFDTNPAPESEKSGSA